jgi:hypothetical protein
MEEPMNTITPELRQVIAQAGEQPVELTDPQTNESFVLIRKEHYDRIKAVLPDPVEEAYPLIDEAFQEGWGTPQMADYDDYEKHRS